MPDTKRRGATLAPAARRALERVATGRGELTYHPTVLPAIARRAGATESGARMVDSILTHSVLPAVSGHILNRVAEGGTIAGAHLSLDATGALRIEVR